MNLSRFTLAQDDPHAGFATALRELPAGRKRSHWIWYIFPQLAGLGSSAMAVTYGLRGIAEATAYLRNPLLRERLAAVTRAVALRLDERPVPRLAALMGSEIDARKLVSSMTLFREVARRMNAAEPRADYAVLEADAEAILNAATAQGLPACEVTMRALVEVAGVRS